MPALQELTCFGETVTPEILNFKAHAKKSNETQIVLFFKKVLYYNMSESGRKPTTTMNQFSLKSTPDLSTVQPL